MREAATATDRRALPKSPLNLAGSYSLQVMAYAAESCARFGPGSVLVRHAEALMKYPNAPLKYVAFAADLSPVAVLGETPALDRIHEALRDMLPVREDQSDALVPLPQGVLFKTSGARFVDSARHLAVLVTPVRIAADTTDYSTFREFSSFLETVLEAISEVARGRACTRLGLRYVDEIRVPGTRPGDVTQWREWIDSSSLPWSSRTPNGDWRTRGVWSDRRYE